MLDIAALLNDLEEPPQLRFGKQLRQLALLLCPAQAQLPAGLLGNVEEIVVVEPRFAGDADELRHDFGFRFFLWRYEVRPFSWTLAAHGRASNGILLRLLVFLRNTIVAPAPGGCGIGSGNDPTKGSMPTTNRTCHQPQTGEHQPTTNTRL